MSSSIRVAALFVDPNGVYSGLPGVDCWGEDRDARTYPGPWPVVAHPPCSRWCRLVPVVEALHPELLPYRGQDGGCFAAALYAVREFGGVLEHPAKTAAWPHHKLTAPKRGAWMRGLYDRGWVTEVSQSLYGHKARKRTWLYYVGGNPPPQLDWTDAAGTHRMSGFNCPKGTPELSKRERAATPPAFRDVLLDMARGAHA